MSRITDLFLQGDEARLGERARAGAVVDRVESNPQLVQIVPPNEVVVLISFELTLGDARGMMNLCIPFNAIERISNAALVQQLGQLRQASRPRRRTSQRISNQLDEARGRGGRRAGRDATSRPPT